MRTLVLLTALLIFSASLPAVGLAKADSLAGLRAIQGPLRITWVVDDATVKMLGVRPKFTDELASSVFARLQADNVDVKDGAFDPLGDPFISLDLWARGIEKPEDAREARRVFHFQMQVFVPASALSHRPQDKGRVLVWERSIYGTALASEVEDRLRTYLDMASDLGADIMQAKAKKGPAKKLGKKSGTDAGQGEPKP